jgi:hypothetical protein
LFIFFRNGIIAKQKERHRATDGRGSPEEGITTSTLQVCAVAYFERIGCYTEPGVNKQRFIILGETVDVP